MPRRLVAKVFRLSRGGACAPRGEGGGWHLSPTPTSRPKRYRPPRSQLVTSCEAGPRVALRVSPTPYLGRDESRRRADSRFIGAPVARSHAPARPRRDRARRPCPTGERGDPTGRHDRRSRDLELFRTCRFVACMCFICVFLARIRAPLAGRTEGVGAGRPCPASGVGAWTNVDRRLTMESIWHRECPQYCLDLSGGG